MSSRNDELVTTITGKVVRKGNTLGRDIEKPIADPTDWIPWVLILIGLPVIFFIVFQKVIEQWPAIVAALRGFVCN